MQLPPSMIEAAAAEPAAAKPAAAEMAVVEATAPVSPGVSPATQTAAPMLIPAAGALHLPSSPGINKVRARLASIPIGMPPGHEPVHGVPPPRSPPRSPPRKPSLRSDSSPQLTSPREAAAREAAARGDLAFLAFMTDPKAEAAEKGAAERLPSDASTSTGSLELRSTDPPTPALLALPRTPIGVDLLVQQWSPPVPDTPERPVPDKPEPPSQRLRATASQSASSLPRAIVRRVVTTNGVPDDAALGALPRVTSSEQRALALAPAPAPREPSPVPASPSSSAARPRIVNQERANELAAALAAAPAGPRGRSPRPGSRPLSPPPGTEL